jgi:hypothetical protein
MISKKNGQNKLVHKFGDGALPGTLEVPGFFFFHPRLNHAKITVNT